MPHQALPRKPTCKPTLLGIPVELRKQILGNIFPVLLSHTEKAGVPHIVFRQRHKDLTILFTNRQLHDETLELFETGRKFFRQAMSQFRSITGLKSVKWMDSVITFEVKRLAAEGDHVTKININERECGLGCANMAIAVMKAGGERKAYYFEPRN